MLLTLTTTHEPATDLGFLLHKHPQRVQQFDLSFGEAHIFYPEASQARCTAALLLEVDPVALVRGQGGGTITAYVNDRPFVASSFLSVALARLFRTAMRGVANERPELADTAIPLEARLVALPCAGDHALLRRLWEPLGYRVDIISHALDPALPTWGESPYITLTLTQEVRLADLLTHLYVLVPVLDDSKHYWVGDDEVDKLLQRGEGWLAAHPERDLITRRYLKHRRQLTDAALERLLAVEDVPPESETPLPFPVDRPTPLNEMRLDRVVEVLRSTGAHRVLDLGCGEGNLILRLLDDPQFTDIVGMDVSARILARAQARLGLDRPGPQSERVTLRLGSLTYRDARLAGFDAAAVVEVIEHLEPYQLEAFERVLWEVAHPPLIVLTTPNADYNVRFPTLPAGTLRHPDHRWEWGRAQFTAWAEAVAARYVYRVELHPVGPVDNEVGAPTQMAVFSRE